MNMELPTLKGLQRRRIKGQGGAQNIRFCETNLIFRPPIFDVTPYANGSYDRISQKVVRVRLEEMKPEGGVAAVMSLLRSSGNGGCRNLDRNLDRTVAPTRREWGWVYRSTPKRIRGSLSKWTGGRAADGAFTVCRWCWKVQCGNGILPNSRLT